MIDIQSASSIVLVQIPVEAESQRVLKDEIIKNSDEIEISVFKRIIGDDAKNFFLKIKVFIISDYEEIENLKISYQDIQGIIIY